jgi:hypothetical protein
MARGGDRGEGDAAMVRCFNANARKSDRYALVETKGAGRARVVLACLTPLAVCG